MMDDGPADVNRALMLDGNALAGTLREVFTVEVTASPVECAGCGRVGEVATLLAFTHAPGMVLRCPACEAVVARVAHGGGRYWLDLRGAAFLQLEEAAAR
jgi:hypothetical protein